MVKLVTSVQAGDLHLYWKMPEWGLIPTGHFCTLPLPESIPPGLIRWAQSCTFWFGGMVVVVDFIPVQSSPNEL
jgi:hypothetical protein